MSNRIVNVIKKRLLVVERAQELVISAPALGKVLCKPRSLAVQVGGNGEEKINRGVINCECCQKKKIVVSGKNTRTSHFSTSVRKKCNAKPLSDRRKLRKQEK